MLLTHPNVNIIVLFGKYYTYLYFVIDTVNLIDETTITYFIFQGRLHSILTVTDVLSIANIAIKELIIFSSPITFSEILDHDPMPKSITNPLPNPEMRNDCFLRLQCVI